MESSAPPGAEHVSARLEEYLAAIRAAGAPELPRQLLLGLLKDGGIAEVVQNGKLVGVLSVRDARLLKTRSISCAKGRLRRIRSWARRSFDDETIFMAFVICCVDLTARTRRRMSISDGMAFPQDRHGGLEHSAVLGIEGVAQPVADEVEAEQRDP